MDDRHFDDLTRIMASGMSRRGVLRSLGRGLAGFVAGAAALRQTPASAQDGLRLDILACLGLTPKLAAQVCIALNLPHVAKTGCVNGRCAILACQAGWSNCDGKVRTGCETPLGTRGNCGACGDSCARLDDACHAGACAGGSCVAQPANVGGGCDDGNPCTVGDVCQPNGACAGMPTDCSAQNDPCNDGVCRPADGACVKQPKANDITCNADSNACTVNDSCQNGVCTPGPLVDCSAQSDLCNDGVCDPATGTCGKRPKANNTVCDDGNACTVGDVCTDGGCAGSLKDCSAQDDPCNDGVCRASDGACIKRSKPDGNGCNADNDSCTVGDSCQNGICTPGTGTNCSSVADQCNDGACDPATGACQKRPKTNGTGCNADSNACTEGDSCQDGACIAGLPKDCSALTDSCNDGVCDPATGTCRKQPKSNGTTCNDGNLCTVNDVCANGVCAGTANDCSATSDQCNDGVCRPADGACITQPKANGTACDADDDSCTENDTCQNGACVAGPVVSCPPCQACVGGDCAPFAGDPRCATVCCGETCCATGEECVDNQCQAACLALQATCDPSDNLCCQTTPTSCASTAPSCGEPGDRCCRDTHGACNNACDCCGLSLCEGQSCCSFPGGDCVTADDCCSSFSGQACIEGTCCVQDGFGSESPEQCCSGVSDLEGTCSACTGLGNACDDEHPCCSSGAESLICQATCDFNQAVCCHAPGGACFDSCDCCGGEACTNGRCCVGDGRVCAASSECCPGFECRNGLCLTEVCLVPGEVCSPAQDNCCPDGFASCNDDEFPPRCCLSLQSSCESRPGLGTGCCGSSHCGSGGTCCLGNFVEVFGGASCGSDADCCNGPCLASGNCCGGPGGQCGNVGDSILDCCTHLGLACYGNGTCEPCGRLGQTCETGPTSQDTCCEGQGGCFDGICR